MSGLTRSFQHLLDSDDRISPAGARRLRLATDYSRPVSVMVLKVSSPVSEIGRSRRRESMVTEPSQMPDASALLRESCLLPG